MSGNFSSAIEDYMEFAIDLNKELVSHPASTFFGRVVGDDMVDSGIFEGDILVIDKSLEPIDGDMAVCFIEGEFCLKTIKKDHNSIWLTSTKSKPIKLTPQNELLIWGIITYTIHKQRGKKCTA